MSLHRTCCHEELPLPALDITASISYLRGDPPTPVRTSGLWRCSSPYPYCCNTSQHYFFAYFLPMMYSSMYFVYDILNNFPNSYQKVGIIRKLRSGKFKTFPGDTADKKLMRHLASDLMGKGPLQLCLSTPPATQIPAVRLVCVASGMVAFHVHVHIAKHTGS